MAGRERDIFDLPKQPPPGTQGHGWMRGSISAGKVSHPPAVQKHTRHNCLLKQPLHHSKSCWHSASAVGIGIAVRGGTCRAGCGGTVTEMKSERLREGPSSAPSQAQRFCSSTVLFLLHSSLQLAALCSPSREGGGGKDGAFRETKPSCHPLGTDGQRCRRSLGFPTQKPQKLKQREADTEDLADKTPQDMQECASTGRCSYPHPSVG